MVGGHAICGGEKMPIAKKRYLALKFVDPFMVGLGRDRYGRDAKRPIASAVIVPDPNLDGGRPYHRSVRPPVTKRTWWGGTEIVTPAQQVFQYRSPLRISISFIGGKHVGYSKRIDDIRAGWNNMPGDVTFCIEDIRRVAQETTVLGEEGLQNGMHYILGTDIVGAPPQIFLPSVMEYPIFDATSLDPEDVDTAAIYVEGLIEEDEEVIGANTGFNQEGLIDEEVIGANTGFNQVQLPWPQGNIVWPGVEIDDLIAEMDENQPLFVLGAPAIPKGPVYFEGPDSELINYLDLERTFDEDFDSAMLRRTGAFR